MGIGSWGKSLQKAGNSTVGNNGKFYFHAHGTRGFYGNKYVKTIKLSDIGNRILKYTGPLGKILNIATIGVALSNDYNDLENYGATDFYHTAKAIGEIIGGTQLGKLGFSAGLYYGTSTGPLGAICISAGSGIIGYYIGKEVGGLLVDSFYRDNNLFIP